MLDIYTVATPTERQHGEAQGRAKTAWLAFTAADQHASDAEEHYDSGDITLEQLGERRQARHLASIAYNHAMAEEFAHYQACKAGEIESLIMDSAHGSRGAFYSETVHEGGGITYWETLAIDTPQGLTVRNTGIRHGQRQKQWSRSHNLTERGVRKEGGSEAIDEAQAHEQIRAFRDTYGIVPTTLTK